MLLSPAKRGKSHGNATSPILGKGARPSPSSMELEPCPVPTPICWTCRGAQIDKTSASPRIGATEIQELRADTKMDSDFNFSKTSILRSLLLALKVDLLLPALQMIY